MKNNSLEIAASYMTVRQLLTRQLLY